MEQPLGQHAVWGLEEACTVPGCEVDLSTLSGYHRRHRVCHIHLKTPEVQLHGQLARFCQQCGRFQPLEDFQDTRRSCKAALRAHNERRRQNTIASDNALAHTRFSTTASTSTSRRSTLSTTTEQHLGGAAGLGRGTRRQLAKAAASLRSSGYSAEGTGALRRTISNPDRSLRPSSHSYEAWSGSYSLSDGAACLQPQQQQQYSLADSPTASSGSTAAVQHVSFMHNSRLRAQGRNNSQNTHLQALALHQRQQALQLQTPDWHSGCNPAVAQLDAAQLLQAAAAAAGQAAAAAAFPVCMAPQTVQLHRSALTRQEQRQQLSMSAGALPAWQQQQLPPCTQGLAAAPGMLAGWQHQQQFVPGCQGLDALPIAWLQPQQQPLHAPNTFSGSAAQCAGMDASLSGWHAQASSLEAPQSVLQTQLQQQSVITAASAGWPAAGLQPILPHSLGGGCHMSDNWGEGCHMQGLITTAAFAQQPETQHPAVALAIPSAAQHAPGALALTGTQCAPLAQQQAGLQHATETAPAAHAPAGGGLLPMPDSSSAPSVTLQRATTGQQVLTPPGQMNKQGSYQAQLLGCTQVVYAPGHLQQQLQDTSAQTACRTAMDCINKQKSQQQLEAQAPAQAAAAPDTLPLAPGTCPDTASAVQLSSSSGARASPLGMAAAAAVSAPAAAAAGNSCLSPELGFWECMAAAETADDFSSEEIDALLEHVFGDFLAPEHDMCETAAMCEIAARPGCCDSSAPNSSAGDCAPPVAGAAACAGTAGSHAL